MSESYRLRGYLSFLHRDVVEQAEQGATCAHQLRDSVLGMTACAAHSLPGLEDGSQQVAICQLAGWLMRASAGCLALHATDGPRRGPTRGHAQLSSELEETQLGLEPLLDVSRALTAFQRSLGDIAFLPEGDAGLVAAAGMAHRLRRAAYCISRRG